MRRRALAVAVVLLAVAPAASAERASEAPARERYARGQELFSSGDYQGALVEFVAAHEAQPHPVVLKSQAECHEQLGNYREAVRLLRQYLEERPGAPDRADIEARIEAHSQRPASVRIVTDPPGAVVTLDGARLEETTPVSGEVPSGDHAVAIELDGYEMVLEEFSVEFGETRTVEVTLEPTGEPTTAPLTEGPSAEGSGEGDPDAGSDSPRSTIQVSTPVWIMAGIAGAGLITGIVSGSLALSDQGDFDDGVDQSTPRADLEAIGDSGQTKALVADIAFGVAAAAAVTGIILFFVDNASEDTEQASGVSIVPTVASGGGGVSASLRF